jgi:phosphatidylglycerophosphate synthase
MFDRSAIRLIQPAVVRLAQVAHRSGLSANVLTLLGFGIGVLAACLIATGAFLAGLVALLISRLCDALDGAVARLTQTTDAGGFLDITLDFLFYGSIPLAFALHDPARNALPAAVLLFTFIGTGSSFLAFATIAAKRGLHNLNYPDKSFYFLGGLTEAGETLACFCVMCLWPGHFIELAYGFAALCLLTIFARLWWGWRTFA